MEGSEMKLPVLRDYTQSRLSDLRLHEKYSSMGNGIREEFPLGQLKPRCVTSVSFPSSKAQLWYSQLWGVRGGRGNESVSRTLGMALLEMREFLSVCRAGPEPWKWTWAFHIVGVWLLWWEMAWQTKVEDAGGVRCCSWQTRMTPTTQASVVTDSKSCHTWL